jgi:hypothetical protein
MFTIATELLELRLAIHADRLAKAAARQRGLEAALPLTESRLGELCELGERMRGTEARLEAARRKYLRTSHTDGDHPVSGERRPAQSSSDPQTAAPAASTARLRA